MKGPRGSYFWIKEGGKEVVVSERRPRKGERGEEMVLASCPCLMGLNWRDALGSFPTPATKIRE